MLPLRMTKKAIQDLKEIGRFIQETWGREQRNRYLSKLDECLQNVLCRPYRDF